LPSLRQVDFHNGILFSAIKTSLKSASITTDLQLQEAENFVKMGMGIFMGRILLGKRTRGTSKDEIYYKDAKIQASQQNIVYMALDHHIQHC